MQFLIWTQENEFWNIIFVILLSNSTEMGFVLGLMISSRPELEPQARLKLDLFRKGSQMRLMS